MSLVRVENLVKDYPLPKKNLLGKAPVYRALDGINLRSKKVKAWVLWGNQDAVNPLWPGLSWRWINQRLEKYITVILIYFLRLKTN